MSTPDGPDSPNAGDPIPVDRLRSAIQGRVITPGDGEYEQARIVFMGGVDSRPAVIVQAEDADDVARVIELARATGRELAVRGGGHSYAGFSTTEGGIVLDLRSMKTLDIDVEGRSAWAGAGLTSVEYSTMAADHGLATGFGDTGSVGIAGLTLGGGIGYLVRKFGLTIDSLLAADIVTADGQLRRVDPGSDPDLFWAIRGGGGNFGVVTRFQFRLHDLPEAFGGMLVLPATADTIAGFVAAADTAPEELSTIANIMPAPPMPFLPEEVHGQLIVLGMLLYTGGAEAGEQAVAPFRTLGQPLADQVRPMAYPEVYPPDDPSYHPKVVNRTMFIDRIGHAQAQSIVDYLSASDATMRVAQVRVLGGAMSRVPVEATAFAHRSSRIMVNVAAFFDGATERALRESWAGEFASVLRQGSPGAQPGAYVNFLGNEGEERVREAYPGWTWERLAEVKLRYDPDNLFRLNQNIPPAAPAESAYR